MHVAICVLHLQLHGVYSLKDKRRIVKSIVARLQQQFKLSVAEIDAQDVWQTAVIGLAIIGNNDKVLHSTLQKAVNWVEDNRPDVPITAYEIEFR